MSMVYIILNFFCEERNRIFEVLRKRKTVRIS